MIGTPGYMAPEQALGSAIDARADLFSLGCVLYEAVTGVTPFHGTAVVEVLARVLLETPAAVSTLRSDVPERLASLIEILMAKSAAERAPSAAAVAHELRAIRDALDRGDAALLASACPLAPISDEPATQRGALLGPRKAVAKQAPVVRRPWRLAVVAAVVVVFAAVTGARLWSRRDRTKPDQVHVELAPTPRSPALALGPLVDGQVVGTPGLHQQAGDASHAILVPCAEGSDHRVQGWRRARARSAAAAVEARPRHTYRRCSRPPQLLHAQL